MNAFFTSISPEGRALLGISLIWLAGFLGSRATKAFSLPNVTGYILAGVVIGPYCLNLLPTSLVEGMSFMTDAALALIAFGVGRYLTLDRLWGQGGKIILLTLMEALVAAVLVTLIMLGVFRLPLSFSLLLGAIASATAPASSLMTIRQYKAKGVFVNTLIQVVALDDAVSLLAFSLCAAIAAQTEAGGTLASAVQPLLINLGILLVAYLLGRLLCVTVANRSTDHRISLTLAFILLLAGGCACVNVSPLLGCMVMGATYANVTRDKVLFKQVNRVLPPISMIFFVLSGMRLNIDALATAGIIGLVYFAVRIVGKMLGAWFGGRLIQAPQEVRRYLGLALIPQAGVSIGLAVLAQRILPAETGTLLSTIILSSSVLYEMIGPVSAKRALTLAGAIRPGTQAPPLPPPTDRPEDARRPEPEPARKRKGGKAEPPPAPDKVKTAKKEPEPAPAKPKPEKKVKLDKADKKAEARARQARETPARPEPAKPDKPARPDKDDKPAKGKKAPPPEPVPEPAPEPAPPESGLRGIAARLRKGSF